MAEKETFLRCIAVDDEPFALNLLADDISKIPFLRLLKTCSSAAEAMQTLEANNVDLMFLDIQMPGMTGTQFLRQLRKSPMVIMTTAYEQYAVEGFELNVLDYLVKPITAERLSVAAAKALHQHTLEKNSQLTSAMQEFFFVHAEYKEIKIMFSDILYIEGFKDYVKIFLSTQNAPVLTRLNLKAIESKLPATLFVRIHNSFIVALSRIESFQKTQVFIRQKPIPIGEKYAEEFRKRYMSP